MLGPFNNEDDASSAKQKREWISRVDGKKSTVVKKPEVKVKKIVEDIPKDLSKTLSKSDKTKIKEAKETISECVDDFRKQLR